MRTKMLVAISEVHSGNSHEAEKIIDAALDALMVPTAGMSAEGYSAAYAADTGVDEIAEVVVENAYTTMIRAAKEGK